MKNLKFIFTLVVCIVVVSGKPVFSQVVGLDEIEKIAVKEQDNSKKLDRDHWAYKRLVNITEKHGLLVGESENFFDSDKPLSRNEAAVILVNLMGKVREDNTALSEVEKEQIQILKEEFEKEIDFISGRVEKLETSVDALQGRISRTPTFGFGEKMQLQTLLQIKFAGLMQRGSNSDKANFNTPYARIRFSGKLQKHLDYRVDIRPDTNFSSSRNGILNNAYIVTDIIPKNKLYMGQMRTPIGYEGTTSAEELALVERSQISRNFSNKRDTGLQLKGATKFLDYSAGIFNGQGYNSTDAVNSEIDYGLWGVLKPLAFNPELGCLKLGGGYYDGGYSTGTRPTTSITHNHETVSYYGEYDYKKFRVLGEYATKSGYGSNYDKDADGWYLHSDYFLTDKLQLLVRFDTFRPNTALNSKTNEYTAGLNYYFKDKNLKLQFDYVFINNYNSRNGHKLLVLSQYLI